MRETGSPPQAFEGWAHSNDDNQRADYDWLFGFRRAERSQEACSGELAKHGDCHWSGGGGGFLKQRMCAVYCYYGDVILPEIKVLLPVYSAFRCTQHSRARFHTL